MKRGVVPLISAMLLVTAALALSNNAVAPPQDEPNDIFLFIDDYTNYSIVDAMASLNFSSAPPPPNKVDNISFEWFAPNGTKVFEESIDPNDDAWAHTSFLVNSVGMWTVNATYTTNTSVHESLDFWVYPNIWGPGSLDLNLTTVVGRSGSLLIQPGTQVRLPPGVFPDEGGTIRVQGKLTAIGTDASPIVFTSSSTTPAPGDWFVLSFIEDADNASIISEAIVRYSKQGIRVRGVSPTITNVTFSDNLINNLRATRSSSHLSDLTVTGGAYGVDLYESDTTLQTSTITGSNYGLILQRQSGRAVEVTITNCAYIGLHVYNTTAYVRDIELSGNDVGVRVDNSVLVADNISVAQSAFAFEVVKQSDMLLSNSTLADVGTLHYSILDTSHVTARNVTMTPTGSIKKSIDTYSLLTVQNFLWVRALSYETGAPLSGVSVEVRTNGVLVSTMTTSGGGIAGPLLLTYGVYDNTSFDAYDNIASVQLSGLVFSNASRYVSMQSNRVETFLGSTNDFDNDGNPDFNDTDDDNDGLSDQVEQSIGTNPQDPDTDNDGMLDGWERDNGLDPTDPADRVGDIDGDGLSNLDEYYYGTDPNIVDSDGDGMPDGWEAANGLDPSDPSDADDDPDGDGFTNLDEFRNATNPQDWGSRPMVKPDLGILGVGDYWPILLLPLVALILMVALAFIMWIFAVPRRGRRKSPPIDELEDID